MKKLLLTVAAVLACFASANAQTTDPSVYTDVDGYSLKNVWIRAETTGNNPTNELLGGSSMSRGMAVKDGQMLFTWRKSTKVSDDLTTVEHKIVVLDGATGAKVKDVVLGEEIFGDNGLGNNDIQVDNAGNVLVSTLAVSLSTAGNFQVWKVNMEDGSGTHLLSNVEMAGADDAPLRIDAFDVYGDVNGEGMIMAAISGTVSGAGDLVMRWDITGGVVNPEPTVIQIQSYYPSTVLASGTGPRVCIVDNDYFYLDGFTAAPALYDMDGNIIESFESAPDLAPLQVGGNGVDEFSINGKNFIVYNYTNTVPSDNPQTWSVCELGEGMTFSGMKQYFIFPAMGVGGVSNPVRTALPRIEVKDNVATLYVYATNSGCAVYKFGKSADVDGVASMDVNALAISATANGVAISEAAQVEVYNFVGQKVASAVSANFVALPAGNYIVKATTAQTSTTAKVIVK
ncbi:MAG: T9SS type A sorting domain-containing protein [Bacteroidaceae bacterium]|nr:T9SS type A sorting domain-containing protein [Bacteroidaceae bacterium]